MIQQYIDGINPNPSWEI